MKTKQLSFLFFLIAFVLHFSGRSQKTDFYFKDATTDVSGFKFEINQAVAVENTFKATVIVNNPGAKYMIIDVLEIFGTVGEGDIKSRNKKSGKIIVEPKSTEKFDIKFKDLDYRKPNFTIHFSSIKITDSAVAVYDFKELPLVLENHCKSGPLTWVMTSKDFDIHRGIRVLGKVKYRGDKFLTINLENAFLTTSDGGKYYNSREEGGLISTYNLRFYRPGEYFEKQVMIFPAKKVNLKTEKNATLNLTNVFKEYSLNSLSTVSIHLTPSSSQ